MRASYAMPSASRVSAACFIVAQSDWLPMMTAPGFADTGKILNAAPMFRPRKGADYRNRPQGCKSWTLPSRNDVRRQLVLDEGNSVAQNEFAFFQALNLDKIDTRDGLQRFDRSVKVAMLLPQPLELCLQLDFFFFGHSQPPNPNVAPSLPSRSPPVPPACGEGLGRGR